MKNTWLIGFFVMIVLISGCTAPKTETQPAATPAATTMPPATTAPTTTATPTTTTTPATIAVEIKGFAFNPATITVPKGTTVTWTQKDSALHTVTADGNVFDSDILRQGQTFSHTFNETVTIEYSCHIHPSMRGKVIVTG